MPPVYRTALPALCLSLILPCALSVQAAEPAPASVATQPEQRQALSERSQEEAAALQRTVPAQEQQQLQVGSETFLVLWKPANTSEAQGVVIILPGSGETADWPQAIAPLRQRLPDADWGSLSLTLPDLQSNAPVPRILDSTPAPLTSATPDKDASTAAPIEQVAGGEDEGTDHPAAQTADELINADAQRIYARIDAAVAFAEQQNARSIVLLGHGTGAYWAARYLSEKQPAQVARLVMVAAQVPPTQASGLAELTAGLKLATLDLYYNDKPLLQRAAQERQQASKRVKEANFRQVSLNALPGNNAAEQEQLVRRVRGWLSPQKSE